MPIKTTTNVPDPILSAKAEKSEEDSLVVPVSASPVEKLEDDPYMREMSILNEEVEICVLPTQDKLDTTRIVTVSVNGRAEHFMRGEWKKVKRYYVEQLARAKRESWEFSYKRAPDGSTVQTEYGIQSLRFPFNIRDANPKGTAWLQSLYAQKS